MTQDDNWHDYTPRFDDETGREIIPNPERGCGYLEPSKGYVRADPTRGGEIPPFVKFDPPIPYKEGTLRSYQTFDGKGFQRSLPEQFSTRPADDLSDLWDRLHRSEDGDHWGELTTAYAEDLLMWVGETYYSDPGLFVDEARKHGLNKGIPVSKRSPPPVINPMKTRCFVIHPTAYRVYVVDPADDDEDAEPETIRVAYMDDDRWDDEDADDPVETVPGVIGYSYLSRVVWTAPEDGDVPKWAQDYRDTGQLDVVDIGEPIPEDEVEKRLEEWDGSLQDPEARSEVHDMVSQAAETATPGHGTELGDLEDMSDDVDEADNDGDDDAEGSDAHDTGDEKSDSAESDATDDKDILSPPDEPDWEAEAEEAGRHDYHELRSLASELGVHPPEQNPTKDALVEAIAGKRVYSDALHGPNKSVYRLTDDGDVEVVRSPNQSKADSAASAGSDDDGSAGSDDDEDGQDDEERPDRPALTDVDRPDLSAEEAQELPTPGLAELEGAEPINGAIPPAECDAFDRNAMDNGARALALIPASHGWELVEASDNVGALDMDDMDGAADGLQSIVGAHVVKVRERNPDGRPAYREVVVERG